MLHGPCVGLQATGFGRPAADDPLRVAAPSPPRRVRGVTVEWSRIRTHKFDSNGTTRKKGCHGIP